MGADREYLRFNVPLEMDVPEDKHLFELFDRVPNGLKQEVVKLALQSILPESDDEEGWGELLNKALSALSKSGRSRGRKKRSDGEPPRPRKPAAPKPVDIPPQAVLDAVPKAVPDGTGQTTQSVVVESQKEVVVEDVTPEVVTPPVVAAPVATKGSAELRQKFGGMIGRTNWSNKQ